MYMNSPVVSGDLLLGFSHLKKGQLFCLDARTGTTLGPGRRVAETTPQYLLVPPRCSR